MNVSVVLCPDEATAITQAAELAKQAGWSVKRQLVKFDDNGLHQTASCTLGTLNLLPVKMVTDGVWVVTGIKP